MFRVVTVILNYHRNKSIDSTYNLFYMDLSDRRKCFENKKLTRTIDLRGSIPIRSNRFTVVYNDCTWATEERGLEISRERFCTVLPTLHSFHPS